MSYATDFWQPLHYTCTHIMSRKHDYTHMIDVWSPSVVAPALKEATLCDPSISKPWAPRYGSLIWNLYVRLYPGGLSKLWSPFGFLEYSVPCSSKDPKRNHNTDNHPHAFKPWILATWGSQKLPPIEMLDRHAHRLLQTCCETFPLF